MTSTLHVFYNINSLRGSSIYILDIFSKRMKIVSNIFATVIKISIETFRYTYANFLIFLRMRKSRLLVITLRNIYEFYDMM